MITDEKIIKPYTKETLLSIETVGLEISDNICIPEELYLIDTPMCMISLLSLVLIGRGKNFRIYDLDYYNDNWEKILDIIHFYLSKITKEYYLKWTYLDNEKYKNITDFYYVKEI